MQGLRRRGTPRGNPRGNPSGCSSRCWLDAPYAAERGAGGELSGAVECRPHDSGRVRVWVRVRCVRLRRPPRVPCTPGTAELSTPASFKFVRTCVPASPPPSSRPSATQPPSKHMHPSVTSRSHCPRIGACSCRNSLAIMLHNVYQVAAQAIPNHGFAHSFLRPLQQCHSDIDVRRLHLAPSGMLHCRSGAPWLI
jgi:hypothetical protein